MNSWSRNLQALRTRELEIAFHGCPDKLFPKALELGAGSGFQSAKLARFAEHLTATELNPERFHPDLVPGVEYLICDAEQVQDSFAPGSFQLIFASNLMEHLPDPEKALRGIRTVLADDGIAILIMPNALWKLFSLLGFYPNSLKQVAKAVLEGRMQKLWIKYISRSQSQATNRVGNNLKYTDSESIRAGIFWPVPHGAYPSHTAELKQYRKRAWIKRFKNAGFDVVTVRNGPVSSGYGFGYDRVRRLLEKVGCTTEYIYVLSITGEDSPYARFWSGSFSGKE